MDFFLNLLSHLWAILSLLATIYCYLAVRKSKFVVVTERIDKVVILREGLDIKINNSPLGSNLYFYKLVICYTGVKDIQSQDVKIPFTLMNTDKSCRWLNIKILKCSSTFKPKIKVKSNKLTIENSLFKTGDSLVLEFLIESKTNTLNYSSRIHDVAVDAAVYNNNEGSYSIALIFSIIISIVFSSMTSFEISNFLNGKKNKGDYEASYEYKNQPIKGKYQYNIDYTTDSLYKESYFINNIPATYFYQNVPDTSSLGERMRILGEMMMQKNKYEEFEVQVENNKPTVRAKKIFFALKAKHELKWGQTYKIDNSFTLKFSDPKRFNWKNDLGDLVLILMFSSIALFFILASTYFCITYFSIRRAYKMLK